MDSFFVIICMKDKVGYMGIDVGRGWMCGWEFGCFIFIIWVFVLL